MNQLILLITIVKPCTYSIIETVQHKGAISMEKYVCSVCGYIYDPAEGCPDQGIAPGTPWDQVADSFTCPLCGVGKDQFEAE